MLPAAPACTGAAFDLRPENIGKNQNK